MDTLERLNESNRGMTIYSLNHEKFGKYGKIYKDIEAEPVMSYLKRNASAEKGLSHYLASISEMEVESPFKEYVKNNIFGGMDIEIGWCYGWNTKMKGMEYHKGSEVIVAATECVLLLGRTEDIEICDGKPVYHSSKTEAFYVETGTVLELYAYTLHLAPLQVKTDGQFITGIILARGTNDKLSFTPENDAEGTMLAAKNKWLLLHPEAGNNKLGMVAGENIEIKTL